MITISVKMPEWMVKILDELVKLELFPSRSELIREALREYLKKYLKEMREISRYVAMPIPE